MKKTSLIKKIALSLACFLGLSAGISAVATMSDAKAIDAYIMPIQNAKEGGTTEVFDITVARGNNSRPGSFDFRYFGYSASYSEPWMKFDNNYEHEMYFNSPTIIRSVDISFSKAMNDSPYQQISKDKVRFTVTGSGTTYTGNGGLHISNINKKCNLTIKFEYVYDPDSSVEIYDPVVSVTRDSANVVTFNANGIGTAPASQEVGDGEKVTKPTNPKATGYTFGGWYKEPACTNAWNFDTDTVTRDTTLYAKWTHIDFAISWDFDGGTTPVTYPTSYHQMVGFAIDPVNNPVKAGYEFVGWSGTGISGTSMFINVPSGSTGNRSYKANWELEEYTIDYGSYYVEGNPTKYTIFTETFTLINPTYTGYTFAGWSGTGIPDDETCMTVTIPQGSTGNREYWGHVQANKYDVTLDPNGGSGGTSTIKATYGSGMPKVNSLPTWEGHTFIGYFDAVEGGAMYIDSSGNSARSWNKAHEWTLYAHWLVNVDCTVEMDNGFSGVYDGDDHYIVVSPTIATTGEPLTDATIYYGTSESSCNNSDLEQFKFSEAGDYTVYYKVERDGYQTKTGSKSFTIAKAESAIESNPTAITGLQYTGEDQTLIQAGSANYGNMLYALTDEEVVPADGAFSEDLPEACDVGTYYVFYKTSGDNNHNPVASSETQMVTIQISRVSRTEATLLDQEVQAFINTYEERFESITDDLEDYLLDFEDEAIVEDNVTASELEDLIEEMREHFSLAKVGIMEGMIEDINVVVYPDSETALEETRNYYDNVLTADEKLMVDGDLYDNFMFCESVYDKVDNVVTLVKNLPTPSEEEAYFDACDAAYEAYSTLSANEKDVFENNTEDDYLKTLLDNCGAANTIELIKNIGEITYAGGDADSEEAIRTAESSYQSLTSDRQAIVQTVNYDKLLRAREIYDAVDDLVNMTEHLPTPSEDADYYDAVDAAYEFYGTLDEDELAVFNGATDSNHAKKLLDNVAAREVIEMIEDIGDLVYGNGTNDSLAAITAAKNALEALSVDQKDIVDLVNGETLYHDYEVYNAVDDVVKLIKAIPTPSEEESYFRAVDTAYQAYLTLSFEELVLLRAAIDANHEKILLDHLAARGAIEKIKDIGTLTYGKGQSDSLEGIEEAEEAYAALSADQKAMVDAVNKGTLTHDRTVYDNVDNVVKLIEEIGEVKYNDETKAKIDAARTAYDALTEEEKALVGSFNHSNKTLEDDEAVYEALKVIAEIGEVGYDTDTEDKIEKAREIYDSLSDDQKALLGEEPLSTLTNAESDYATMKTNGDTLVTVLLIVTSLALLGGIFFLVFLLWKRKKEKEDEENKKEPAKAMSIAGFLPFIVLTSHYVDAPYIILYVIAPIAVLIWVAVLVLFILGKKGIGPFKKKAAPKAKEEEKLLEEKAEEPVEEKKPEEKPVEEKPAEEKPLEKEEEKATPESEPSKEEEEDEVITVSDEKGNLFEIRFIKSFTAKLSQSPEETKKYYEELKNEVLSYKKTNSRVSWHYDSVNSGRSQVLRFAIRGKTLGVYLPLDAEKYLDSKYKVEKVFSKKYEDTPCLYRIKNDRRCAYAKELIAIVAEKLGLQKGKEQHESYIIPKESTKALLAKGLIKEQKVQMKKKAEPVVVETKQNADGDEIVRTRDSSGTLFEIRYVKSFTAKLSQASEEVRKYYNLIKNHALSYKKANSRISWHYDAINVGREQVLKFAIRGKTLCVYYALNEVDEKYKVETAKSKKFEDTPCLYRVKNDRRSVYAKELIDIVMKKAHAELGKESSEDFTIPYESTKALLAKGLIKEFKTKVKETEKEEFVDEHHEDISVEEADARMSDEAAAASIEEDAKSKKHEGKKGIINIDTISKNFHDGDKVDLEALWAKKLIPQSVGYVKVLARGTINKRLDLDLQDYSLQAVKMVLLEGGTVKKAK